MDFLFGVKGIEKTNLPDARLAHHPGEPEEEHGAPDVEEARDVNPSAPTKLVHFPLLSFTAVLEND